MDTGPIGANDIRLYLERRLIPGLREHQKSQPTRATAIAITKLEEAAMWLDRTDSTETNI